MTEDELFKKACEECNFEYNPKFSKETFEHDISEVSDKINEYKEMILDAEDDIRRIKIRAQKEVKKKEDRIENIKDVQAQNQKYVDDRKFTLTQMDVIEYRELNPDLEIN